MQCLLLRIHPTKTTKAFTIYSWQFFHDSSCDPESPNLSASAEATYRMLVVGRGRVANSPLPVQMDLVFLRMLRITWVLLFFGHLSLRRNKKQTAVINIRQYKCGISGKKKNFNLTFRMFQHISSEVLN